VSRCPGYMNKNHKTEVHVTVNAAIIAIAGNPEIHIRAPMCS